MNDGKIAFLDLITPHQTLKDELMQVAEQVFDTGYFIGGPMVTAFEKEFAAFCGSKYCIGVNSGTDALRFAFLAGGIAPGDAVITVPNTFIATTEAISQAGALPLFVDIDEKTYNLSPEKLSRFIEEECVVDKTTGKPRHKRSNRPVTAIVPVHLYGQTADMDSLLAIASRYGMSVFEDACQAHGSRYFSKKGNAWKNAGTIGKAGAFSFYPGKNLGACGEGGAITTDDDDLAKITRMLRDHGQATKYYHDIEGYNGRLDAMQAGLLSVKLKHLAGWNERRRQHAALYDRLLGTAVGIPFVPSWAQPIFHLYVVRVKNREKLQAYLAEKGIGTALHYPVPLHLQVAYKHLGYKQGDFPASESAALEILSLPMFPELTEEQQTRVAGAIGEFYARA